MCCGAVTHCVLSCSVTSSEKVDKAQRYADFTLLSIPYPGRELLSGSSQVTGFQGLGALGGGQQAFLLRYISVPGLSGRILCWSAEHTLAPSLGFRTQGRALS